MDTEHEIMDTDMMANDNGNDDKQMEAPPLLEEGNHKNDRKISSANSDDSSTKPKEYLEMLLIKATAFKEEGNNYFIKEKDFEKASRSYRKGVNVINNLNVTNSGDEQVKALLLSLHTNLSMMLSKLGKHQQSKEVATKALEIDATYVKAIYRRAIAHRKLGNTKRATMDLKLALQTEPENSAVRKALASIQKEIQKEKDEEDQKLIINTPTMTTKKHSFLPNRTLINALVSCANCCKIAEPFTLKMCAACRSVSYCNVDCQKNHRKDHKHQCKQGVQYIKGNIKENNDDGDGDDDADGFFQPIPPQDDCPICALPLAVGTFGNTYKSCCGNIICKGCSVEDMRATKQRGQIPRCPFCREPNASSDNEQIVRIEKRMEMDDSDAIFLAFQWYNAGLYGLPKNPKMAVELCIRAAELGHVEACDHAANFYKDGVVVPKDMTTARNYLKKSTKNGGVISRHNLGVSARYRCNYRLAAKHWLISAAAGYTESLDEVARSYRIKMISKKQYSAAVASYIKIHKDEWSIEREEAEKEETA